MGRLPLRHPRAAARDHHPRPLRRPLRRALLAVLPLALVAGGGAWWVRARTRPAPRALDAPAREGACRVRSGTTQALAGELRVLTSLDLGRGVAAGGQGGVGLAATPAQRVEAVRTFTLALAVESQLPDGGHVLRAQLRELAGSTEGKPEPAPPPGVSAPFRVRVDRRCALRDFGWARGADLEDARQQQALVASLSYAAPGAGERSRFEAPGLDAVGRHVALHQLVDDTVLSRVVRYERLFDDPVASGARASVRIERSVQRARLADGHLVRSLERTLELRYLLGGTPVGSLRLEARYTPAESAPPEAADGPFEYGVLLERERAAPTAAGEARAAPDPRLRDVTYAALLAEVTARIKDPRANPAEYVVTLSDWLRLHPEAVPTLLEQLREGALDEQPRLRAALFHAMAHANTTETRGALDTIFEGKGFAYGRRVDAAQVMVLLEPPPPRLLEGLAREAREATDAFGRGSMLLAVGMLAGQHQAAHPELAAQAREHVRSALGASTRDERALVLALQSAGNAAHDALHPDVARFLEDRRAGVREAAADALRGASPKVALPTVERALADETDGAVRGRLLDTAVQLARRADGPAPPALVATASAEAAAPTGKGALTQALDLLDLAAERGDASAKATLKRLLDAERAKGKDADPARLQELGRHVETKWVAP